MHSQSNGQFVEQAKLQVRQRHGHDPSGPNTKHKSKRSELKKKKEERRLLRSS